MAKEELIEMSGMVTEVLPDSRFRVTLETGHKLVAAVLNSSNQEVQRKVLGLPPGVVDPMNSVMFSVEIGPLAGGWIYDSVSQSAPFTGNGIALAASAVILWLGLENIPRGLSAGKEAAR